mmetsp:Transcript_6226/g.8104  ORF Transcript_6226/g.8104 Transcript_6226/m.8104 type:complete len:151 (+) Transcript_6226:201-653(+)
MGLFSKNTRDKDFDVEANAAAAEPPLVEATPIAYAAASLPTPAQAIATNKLNAAQQQQQQQTLPAYFGRHPTNMPQCPHCAATNVPTRTSTFPSIETWLLCLGILLVFWPACWIPLVMDTAKKTEHVCTRCHEVVGAVKPMSDCCVKERG